jgi:GT2 family glycosyltransferase
MGDAGGASSRRTSPWLTSRSSALATAATEPRCTGPRISGNSSLKDSSPALCFDRRQMDAERWRADERDLREAVRSARRPSEGSTRPTPAGAPTPLVSVIVVCWNSAEVLGGCLDCLLAQDYANYEIVVVDDGSQDDTLAVAQHRASADRDLKIVRSSHNRGCPAARNLGLEHARGEIVAFIDADGFAAASWLRELVAAFNEDGQVGAVASTVFFADNPLVLNGAGGIVNRQGWAADLSMNESYERAELASEALYQMGCGMAIRRPALQQVGSFDDRMLNYYDDVDYGIRLWRSGYRVVVAQNAWIDHGFGKSGGDSSRKRLLCERHRMRVVLKHTPVRSLGRWAVHEARAITGGVAPHRWQKLRAIVWNACHLPSTLAGRRQMRHAAAVPDRLLDPSWGDGFPPGVPPRLTPKPQSAGSTVDMADPNSEEQLLYGWFSAEHVGGHSYRWAGVQAAALVGLRAPVKRLRLRFAHVPVDMGGVDVSVRRLGALEALTPVWGAHLSWQYIERSVENHPLALPAGDYEVLFSAPHGWSDPPRETRSLGFALAAMSFEESYEIASGGLDMASPDVEEQLLSGWFEAEQSAERSYRWAAARAAAVVRLTEDASSAFLRYRFPPGPSGDVIVSVRPVDSQDVLWSTRLAWQEEEQLALQLSAGDYVVAFEAEGTWSNPDQGEPRLPPENRALGFAVSSLSFAQA